MNCPPDAGAPTPPTLAGLRRRFALRTDQDIGDRHLTGVHLDNRMVRPGDLFAALPGAKTHGAQFAAQAIEQGAVAVLTDDDGARRIGPAGVPVLIADDPRGVLGAIAAWIHHEPATRLGMYAVTGTNGKTTTTYLVEYLLRALGRQTGMIGTVELKIGADRTPARLTTPEAPALHQLLADMETAGVDDVVMEVSSHALALHRVDGVGYDVVGFTNLTQDHLDFHGDLEGYYRAKAALFTPQRARRGVVLVDDAYGRRLATEAGIEVVTVSATGADADWQIQERDQISGGSAFTLRHRSGEQLRTSVGLPGGFNVANAALALVMVIEAGVPPGELAEVLPAGLAPAVPGRMERVAEAPRVLVDFAHNTDALREAMAALRADTAGRLFVIFGATGERDAGKRGAMGRVAIEEADVVIVTDDDPHDEDPATIRRQVMSGALTALTEAQRRGRSVELYEIAPRQTAIRRAVRFAAAADTVLVAGRGHETWQEIAGVDHYLDDRQEVRAAMADRQQRRPGSGQA